MPPKPAVAQQSIHLTSLQYKMIRYDSTVLIAGQRGTGKTTFALNLYKYNRLRRTIVICESPEIHSKYRCIDKPFRHGEFDKNFLSALLADQDRIQERLANMFAKYMTKMKLAYRDMCNKKRDEYIGEIHDQIVRENIVDDDKMRKLFDIASKKLELFCSREKALLKENFKQEWDRMRIPYAVDVYFDDCGSNAKIMNDKVLQELMNNGRHYICRPVIMVQYVVSFPKKIRGAVEWLVLFAENNPKNVKTTFEMYSIPCPTLKDFARIHQKITQEHNGRRAMVIRCLNTSKKIEDKIFFCDPEDMDGEDLPPQEGDICREFTEKWGKGDGPTEETSKAATEEDEEPEVMTIPKVEWIGQASQDVKDNIASQQEQEMEQLNRKIKRWERQGKTANEFVV